MVKQRMTTADVAGEVACLRQTLLGMRVANLYDLNSKVHRATMHLSLLDFTEHVARIHSLITPRLPMHLVQRACNYKLTLASSPQPVQQLKGCVTMQTYMLKLARSGEDGEKAFLVLESGSRFHTTQVC